MIIVEKYRHLKVIQMAALHNCIHLFCALLGLLFSVIFVTYGNLSTYGFFLLPLILRTKSVKEP